jgi:hypothetical protein
MFKEAKLHLAGEEGKRSDSVGEIIKEPKLQSVMFLFVLWGCYRTRQQGGQD